MARKNEEDAEPSIEVVSQEQVREEYEQKQIEEAEQKAERALSRRREEVMLDLIDSDRLEFDDLASMLRLGIIGLEDDFLPCQDVHRRYNALDWDSQFEEHLVRKERGEAPPEEDQRPMGTLPRLSPAQVDCPLLARIGMSEEPAPCFEAQRVQLRCRQDGPRSRHREEPLPPLLDPDDPVVGCELRPCLALSNLLLSSIFARLHQRKPRASTVEIETGPLARRRGGVGEG